MKILVYVPIVRLVIILVKILLLLPPAVLCADPENTTPLLDLLPALIAPQASYQVQIELFVKIVLRGNTTITIQNAWTVSMADMLLRPSQVLVWSVWTDPTQTSPALLPLARLVMLVSGHLSLVPNVQAVPRVPTAPVAQLHALNALLVSMLQQ
jgi:hypothetical protein